MKKHLRWIAALGLCGLAVAAQAADVLFLTPATNGDAAWTGRTAAALDSELGAGNWDDGRGLLSNTTALPASTFTGKKLVVLQTVYGAMNPAQVPVIRDAMLNNPNIAFVVFADGCCEYASNLQPIVSILADGTGWPVAPDGSVNTVLGIQAPLNTNSPYAAGFVNPMLGQYYRPIHNVPSAYALYLPPGTPAPAAGAPPLSAYGLFAPHAVMNKGAGACVFLTGDASPLGPDGDPGNTQSVQVIRSFVNAATSPTGACKLPAAGVPDLQVSLTNPGTLTPGTPATYVLDVKNVGVVDSAATTVTLTLPTGLTVFGPLPANCSGGGTSVRCDVAALAPGANGVFAIQVVAALNAPGGVATASVPDQTNEANTANNRASLNIAVAVAVPTLDLWALAALGGLVPLFAARRRRQR